MEGHELRVEVGRREHVVSFGTAGELEAYAARLGLRPVEVYEGEGGTRVHQYGEPDWASMTPQEREAWAARLDG